jgi:hypothetical protein
VLLAIAQTLTQKSLRTVYSCAGRYKYINRHINWNSIMKRYTFCLFLVILITGCAGPRYSGSAIDATIATNKIEVVVIKDDKTKAGFLATIEDWLRKNNYSYVVSPDNSKHNLDKLTIEYIGYWKWDLALYLSDAKIDAFYGGQRMATVDYKAPNTLNGNKFGVGAERIAHMLDVLFGKITAKQATKIINTVKE